MDIYDAARKLLDGLKKFVFLNYGHRCRCCGSLLKTTYLENRIYAVECDSCGIVSLVKARNPENAEAVVGEKTEEG